MSATESTNIDLTAWNSEIQALAQSGALTSAIRAVYGACAEPLRLEAFIEAISRGETSALPAVRVLDTQTMQGHPGAYAAATDTVYINTEILASESILIEVLTHELGHFIADRFYTEREQPGSAQHFTRELLADDYALLLTGSGEESEAHSTTHSTTHTASDTDHSSGQLVLPGAESPTDVMWFDTNLHISWAQQKLPMINAEAFAIFERAQNDSDAFTIVSSWGLQTDSATHFDNNNIRGGLATMRKRWTNGIDNFQSQSIPDAPNGIATIDTALVARGQVGEIAGIANLIYRFGQISHAFQDFYSHSNWLELSRAGNGRWIASNSLLDSGLDIPTQLNPGDYLPSPSHVMVAMSGPNYGQFLQRAGVGSFSYGSKVVNWWADIDQNSWGKVFANPLGSSAEENQVIGLMSGAVNGAIYYDTDYSMELRAVNRSGFFDKEYFRGFSHGGLAGTLTGQWVSPLAKDKEDNSRFSDKNVNKSLYDQAQVLADLQIQNDWDRMGNLIFKTYGVEGLRRFANFAVVEADRDLYVSTYRVAGGRWNWDSVNTSATTSVVASFADVSVAAAPGVESDAQEPETRYVEVFYQDSDSNLTTTSNRSYVMQIDQDGRWVDSAAGLVDVHHDLDASELAALNEAAEVQFTEVGGRGVWSSLIGDNDHHLGTTYHVQQVNTEARVYINNFDLGIDLLQIVDAAGQLIETIDLDHGDFDQTREWLLQTYNIQINARPETEFHTNAKIITRANVGETVLLEASEFFGDHDVIHGGAHDPEASLHSSLIFLSHDETLPWLSLTSDGRLVIDNLSAIPRGTYQTYVSVSDGAGVLDGVLITLSIDPLVTIGEQAYFPDTDVQVTFEQSLSGAISLYGQVYDAAGNAISSLEQLAMRVGGASGTPEGIDADVMFSKLANPTDHGEMQFFAYFHASQEMVMLTLENVGNDEIVLKHDGQVLATIAMGESIEDPSNAQTDATPIIDQFYVSGIQNSIIGLSLAPQTTHTEAKEPGQAYKVTLDTRVFTESFHAGAFGLLLIDLKTGHVVDPMTGVQIENALLNVSTVEEFAVYTADTPRDGQNSVNATLLLDAQLNLNNLAFLPYYIAELPEGSTLFFGMGTGSDADASQIVQAGQNTFAMEEALGGDADFDDLMVRVDAMRVFHSDEITDPTVAFDSGFVSSAFADVTGFEYINGGQGFALTRAEDRDLFVNIDRVQFLDRTATEYDLRASFAPTINFSSIKNGVPTASKPVYFTGEASLDLHYQLIDSSTNMEVAGSRLNDFIALQGEGNKAVEGGVGNDVMDGGKGQALLSGGLGQDTFFLDGRTIGSASITVTDFELGQDRITVWGWQAGLSRVSAIETAASNPSEVNLTLYFENLLSDQLVEDTSTPNMQAMTLNGLSLSDFGVSNVRELNAQIASGSHAHFQTGISADAYGEHGYLFLS